MHGGSEHRDINIGVLAYLIARAPSSFICSAMLASLAHYRTYLFTHITQSLSLKLSNKVIDVPVAGCSEPECNDSAKLIATENSVSSSSSTERRNSIFQL